MLTKDRLSCWQPHRDVIFVSLYQTRYYPWPSSLHVVFALFQESVIVVGAGPAGLAAARHLSNFGMKVHQISSALLTLMPILMKSYRQKQSVENI